jgi:hypothetical protein
MRTSTLFWSVLPRAEISAAELKRGPTKFRAARKIGAEFSLDLILKKGLKRGRTFLKIIIHIKGV